MEPDNTEHPQVAVFAAQGGPTQHLDRGFAVVTDLCLLMLFSTTAVC